MNFYNVNTLEYRESEEFKEIMSFIHDLRLSKLEKLNSNYSDYKIKQRVQSNSKEYKDSQFYYMTHFNVPFYESFLLESLLHKGTDGYLEINEFSFQLNVYCKKIFHRKFWSDWNTGNKDDFLFYVYDLWKKHQRNKEFDLLESIAIEEFNKATGLFDYFKNFVYNEKIQFVTLEQVRELFDALVETGIWLRRDGDLYQIYENINYDADQDLDVKVMYHAGKITAIDELHIRSVVKQRTAIFNSLKTKLNFYPVDDPERRFDGFWNSPKIGNRVCFLPQFLIFYTPQ